MKTILFYHAMEDILDKYNSRWHIEAAVPDSRGIVVSIYSNIYGVHAIFGIECYGHNKVYFSSMWMIDSIDHSLFSNEISDVVEELNNIWADIEDAFNGNAIEY